MTHNYKFVLERLEHGNERVELLISDLTCEFGVHKSYSAADQEARPTFRLLTQVVTPGENEEKLDQVFNYFNQYSFELVNFTVYHSIGVESPNVEIFNIKNFNLILSYDLQYDEPTNTYHYVLKIG